MKIIVNSYRLRQSSIPFGLDLTESTSFLEVLDRTLPELEWVDKKALEKKAKDEDWEFPDFEGERQILDAKFKFWLPAKSYPNKVVFPNDAEKVESIWVIDTEADDSSFHVRLLINATPLG